MYQGTHYKIIAFLTALLLLIIVGGMYHGAIYEIFFTSAYCGVMVMGPFIVFKRRKYIYISVGIALFALVMNYLADITQIKPIMVSSAIVWTLFNAYITVLLLGYTRRIQRVETDHIMVVISSYILIGMTYAALYSVLQFLDPASFQLSATLMESEKEVWQMLLYYSFMTLTTVGYGDLTPHTHLARMFASTEAIVGVMFIGIFVARMVALHSTQTLNRKD